VVDDWTLTAHTEVRSLRLGDVVNATVNVGDGGIRSILATRWQDGSLTAETIGSLYVRGDRRNGIPGDLGVDMTLTGDPGARYVLASARVSGTLGKAPAGPTLWQINGDAGSLTIGTWGADTILAVGVEAGLDGLFLTADDTGTGATLRSLRITAYATAGTGPFGAASDNLATMVIAGQRLGLDDLPFQDGDFALIQV